MQRKVNLVGQNTLTVSLPNEWVKKNHVQKGDEIEYLVDNEKIIFSKNKISKEKKEITLNITDFPYGSIARNIYLLYRLNYSKIKLIFDKNEIYHPKHKKKVDLKTTIQKITYRLIGAEIIYGAI